MMTALYYLMKVERRTNTMSKLWNESHVPPIKAGDIRVLINGEPPRADIRLLSEENYQKALSLEEQNAEMLEALKTCLDVFNKLAEAGRYPEPLLAENGGEGLRFLTTIIRKAEGGNT